MRVHAAIWSLENVEVRESKRFMALSKGTFGRMFLGTQAFADTQRDGIVKVTQSLGETWACFYGRILIEAYFKCLVW